MSNELIGILAALVVLVGVALYFKLPGRIAGWFSDGRAFLKETRSELAKVTFPSRDDVIATTVVVIVASVIFAVFLTFSDFVIKRVYGFVIKVFGA